MSISGSATISGNGQIVFYTIPSAPTGLTASSITSSTATVNFTRPSGKITGFYAYNNGVLMGSYTGVNSINLTGLTAVTGYVITLVAYNAYGKSTMSSSVSFTTISSSRLLCYYKADNMSGNNIGDYYGSTITYDGSMTVVGGTARSTTAKFGSYSFNLSGTSTGSHGQNYTLMNPSSLYNVTNNGFSVCFWFYFVYPSSGSTLCSFSNAKIQAYKTSGVYYPTTIAFLVSNSTSLNIQYITSNGGSNGVLNNDGIGVSTMNTNTWYHVAFTWDSSGNQVAYFNNTVVQSWNENQTIMGFYPNGVNNFPGSNTPSYNYLTQFSLGTYLGVYTYASNALIDEAVAYNKTLSATDVSGIYNGNIIF